MQVKELFLYIISRHVRRWVKTNEQVIWKMWNRLMALESPNNVIFKHLLVSSDIVVENLFNVYKTNKIIYNIDYRKMDIKKLQKLYTLILVYFTFVISYVNRQVKRDQVLKESIRKAIGEITDSPETCDMILKQLSIYYSKSLNEINMGQVAERVWMRISEITSSQKANMNLIQTIYFRTLMENSYDLAINCMQADLNDNIFPENEKLCKELVCSTD